MKPTKYKLKRKRDIEREFCLNHCPHAADSDCHWTPRECMAQAKRHVRAATEL